MTPLDDLETELGAPPPAAFAQLAPEVTADLAALLADARRQRRLAGIGTSAWVAGLLPRWLRARVRRGLAE
jgi:hypothetical protein